jgi:hypothetical protein
LLTEGVDGSVETSGLREVDESEVGSCARWRRFSRCSSPTVGRSLERGTRAAVPVWKSTWLHLRRGGLGRRDDRRDDREPTRRAARPLLRARTVEIATT